MIAPSRANSPEALLNELPPLPSVESIVYPEETARATYYRKIVAVDMRITELDSIHTCSDEEMIALRDKFYVELADINGITVEEMKSLETRTSPKREKGTLDREDEERLGRRYPGGLRPWAPIWRNVRQPKEAS